MAVPKKRVSKSKTQLRKTKWREKALVEAQSVISSLRRNSLLWAQLRGEKLPNGQYPLMEGLRKQIKALTALAADSNQVSSTSSKRGFGSARRQQLLLEKQQLERDQLEKDQLSNEKSNDESNDTDNV